MRVVPTHTRRRVRTILALSPQDARVATNRGDYLESVRQEIERRRRKRIEWPCNQTPAALSQPDPRIAEQQTLEARQLRARRTAAKDWAICINPEGFLVCPCCDECKVKTVSSFFCHLLNAHDIEAFRGVPESLKQKEAA